MVRQPTGGNIGRPKLYHNDEERRTAKVAQRRAGRERQRQAAGLVNFNRKPIANRYVLGSLNSCTESSKFLNRTDLELVPS